MFWQRRREPHLSHYGDSKAHLPTNSNNGAAAQHIVCSIFHERDKIKWHYIHRSIRIMPSIHCFTGSQAHAAAYRLWGHVWSRFPQAEEQLKFWHQSFIFVLFSCKYFWEVLCKCMDDPSELSASCSILSWIMNNQTNKNILIYKGVYAHHILLYSNISALDKYSWTSCI